MEKSFLFRLVYLLNMLWFFVQSGTRCSRNKSKSWNNNIYLTKSSDTIYSPDYDTHDTYPANMSCTWVISLPKNKIHLSFSVFDLQAPGPSCQHGDFVEVRDGEYPDSPVLGTFCGSVIPSDTFSSGSYMLVQFRSDESMEKRGFVTSYRSYDTSNGCKSYKIWPSSGSTSSQTDLYRSFSAAVICVGIAVVFAILVAAVFGVSVMKKWTLHSPGRVKIYRTRPGITIKIFPATPKEPRREVSLNNEIVTAPSSLVPIKAWPRFRRLSSWIKW